VLLTTVGAAAKDVVIMYDTSGSMKERESWRVAVWDANQAVSDLIWDGRISDREKVWTIDYSANLDQVLKPGQSMLDYQGDKDKLMIVYFDEPTSCWPPFFDRSRAFSAKGMGKGWPINDLLPSEKMLRGCCTYLRLAKWSAAEYQAVNTLNPKTDSFFLVIVSDMIEDMQGCRRGPCKCSGEEIIARKINAFEQAYNAGLLVSAQHHDQGPQGTHLAVMAYQVQVKQEDTIKDENKVPDPAEDVPALVTKPRAPIKVITKPPRPPKTKRPPKDMVHSNKPPKKSGGAGWVKYLLYVIIAGMAGSPLIYWGVSTVRRRLKSAESDD
jgi:hypothetical protein